MNNIRNLAMASMVCAGSLAGMAQPAPAISADPVIEAHIQEWLKKMTLEEKIGQMCEITVDVVTDFPGSKDGFKLSEAMLDTVIGKYKVGSILNVPLSVAQKKEVWAAAIKQIQEKSMKEIGIPCIYGVDQIHGTTYTLDGTLFPQGVNMGATFNRSLVRRGAEISAYETKAGCIPWTYAPVVDLGRDPRWPRMWENYGEDCYVNAEMGVEAVKGFQGDDPNHIGEYNVAACMKHYMGYGVPVSGKDRTPSSISRSDMREKHFAPFLAAVRAGALSVMVNSGVDNGMPFHANRELLTEWLKEDLNWDGMIVTDWADINNLCTRDHIAATKKEAVKIAINAGIDMSMVPYEVSFCDYLKELVQEGEVPMSRIDDAVARVLRLKYRLGLFENPYTEILPDDRRFLLPSSLNVAEQLAQESMVLLKNNKGVLPLKKGHKIAFIGPMANNRLHLLGSWSAHGDEKDVVSILDGIRKEKGFIKKNILFADGCGFDGNDRSGFAEAIRVAEQADIIIACLGEKKTWSGENASRSVIALPRIQEELLENLKKTGKPLVVLLSSGRPLDLSRIEPLADAMLEIWQPGITAGIAVAGILSGRYNPSGKLPITFPYTTGQIPIYYNHRKSGRTHQGKYQNITSEPLYSFGHGLSYTKFEYGTLKLSSSKIRRGDTLRAEIEVKNVGNYDGKETLLWFVADPFSSITRPVKELKYFEKKEIPAGESRIFTFDINLERDLGFVNEDGKRLLENGIFYIMVKDQKVKIELID